MKSLLKQKIRQYLVNSFLYYQLDESFISDPQYDRLCMELRELLRAHPDSEIPFREVAEPALGEEASGFSIRFYPPQIISTSLHLLYQERYRNQIPFTYFLERFGYRKKSFPNE